MLMEDSHDLIGTAEAAGILRVNRATVTRWAKAGKLRPVTKLPGGTAAYVFTRTSVKHLAVQQRKGS